MILLNLTLALVVGIVIVFMTVPMTHSNWLRMEMLKVRPCPPLNE